MSEKAAPKPRTKIIITGLPVDMKEEAFLEAIAEWKEKYNYLDYYEGKKSFKKKKTGHVYINFVDAESMQHFVKKMQTHSFVDDRNTSIKLSFEYAPYQAVPSDFTKRKSAREGTIEKDDDYLSFVERLNKPKETVSAEAKLEQRIAEEPKDGDDAIISPLLLDLKAKQELQQKKRMAKKNRQAKKNIKKEDQSPSARSNANANRSNANRGKGRPNANANANAGKGQGKPAETEGNKPKRKRNPRRKNNANKSNGPQLVPGAIKIQQKPAANSS